MVPANSPTLPIPLYAKQPLSQKQYLRNQRRVSEKTLLTFAVKEQWLSALLLSNLEGTERVTQEAGWKP